VEDHPTIQDFERFLQRSPQPSRGERNAQVVLHLLKNCTICRQALGDLRGGRALLSRLLEFPLAGADSECAKPAKSYNYDWAFARAERTFASSLTKGGSARGLPERLAELAGLPEGEQIRRVGLGGRFANPEFILLLLDRIHSARYQSPKKMLHWAQLVRLASEACTAEAAGGDVKLADLQAQAWRSLANALRICGYLPEADKTFVTAFQKAEHGSHSPQLQFYLLSQLTSLRISQRRFQDALALAEKAEQISRDLGEKHLLASVRVQKATVLIYSGEAEAAAKVFAQAIPLIDHDEDPHLFLAAHHNLERCYIDLDRPAEALALHYEAKPLYQECKDPLILLRADWQEGLLLREIGHLRSAESALLRASQGFTEQGLAYETAMVCLDLADVYSKMGKTDELRRTIAEAMPIFRSMRLGREVLASLLHLQQAAGMDLSEEE